MTDLEAWRADPRERLLAAIDRTWARGVLGTTPEELVDEYTHQLAVGCPHCPDGHTPPARGSQPWSAWVAEVRDGDGQPMQIIVARSAGAHVAESDAEWIRKRLNDTTEAQ